MFKKLYFNIFFIDALEQMPSYVNLLKEILSNKRKLEEYKTISITEKRREILQKKFHPKLRDQMSLLYIVQLEMLSLKKLILFRTKS